MPYLEKAVEIAREAGVLLANYFERRVTFEVKGEFDLVTEADRASEKLVVERLRSHFPSHAIVAEEGSGHSGASEFLWYVDPLDGTTNFAHNFPMFNVTLALERAGFRNPKITIVLSPPWTTEWITVEGRAKLKAFGIAPPAHASSRGSSFAGQAIACPRCGSEKTAHISEFGSTPCKALYRCNACAEPFDYFKCI